MEDFSGHNITKVKANIGSKESVEQRLKKYFLAFFLFVACFIMVVVIRRISSALSAPDLVLPEATYNFGSVSYGQALEYKFSIKNDGTIPVLVDSVETSCECLTAAIDTRSIDPQDTAIVSGIYKPTEDNFDYAKDISEHITVKTSQAKQKEVVFTVSAKTIPQF